MNVVNGICTKNIRSDLRVCESPCLYLMLERQFAVVKKYLLTLDLLTCAVGCSPFLGCQYLANLDVWNVVCCRQWQYCNFEGSPEVRGGDQC